MPTKILQFSPQPLKNSQGQAKINKLKKTWRLQRSAIFWHLSAFLFPSFAVWQGLYLRWQIWFSLLALLLFLSFFWFFLSQSRLELLTQEPKKVPFWKKPFWQSLRLGNSRNSTLKNPPAAASAIFGNYANDGTGEVQSLSDDDDGVTIEDYLNRGQAENFDWNWQNSRAPKPRVKKRKTLRQLWRQNWTLAWHDYSLPVFLLTSLLWGPLVYFAVRNEPDLLRQRLGLYGAMFFILLVWNIFCPILEQWQKGKLSRALAGQRKLYSDWAGDSSLAKLPVFLNLAIEAGTSLAIALLVWPFISGLAFIGSFVLLLVFSNWFRLNLQSSFSLYLHRLFSCLSASVALLLV